MQHIRYTEVLHSEEYCFNVFSPWNVSYTPCIHYHYCQNRSDINSVFTSISNILFREMAH